MLRYSKNVQVISRIIIEVIIITITIMKIINWHNDVQERVSEGRWCSYHGKEAVSKHDGVDVESAERLTNCLSLSPQCTWARHANKLSAPPPTTTFPVGLYQRPKSALANSFPPRRNTTHNQPIFVYELWLTLQLSSIALAIDQIIWFPNNRLATCIIPSF